MPDSKLILVTGATGYVGGRLVPRLLAAGYRVRCLVRDPTRLQGRAWLNQVDLAQGDMLQSDSLAAAMRDVWVVYYLVHSLGGGSDFSERDLAAARHCARVSIASWTGNPFSSPSFHSARIFLIRLASSGESPAQSRSKSVSSIRHSSKFNCGWGSAFVFSFVAAGFSFGTNSVGNNKSAMASYWRNIFCIAHWISPANNRSK